MKRGRLQIKLQEGEVMANPMSDDYDFRKKVTGIEPTTPTEFKRWVKVAPSDQPIKLTRTERNIISCAIHMWINYMETGVVWRSANESKKMGLPSKELNADQVEIIQELRDLAKKVLVPNDMK